MASRAKIKGSSNSSQSKQVGSATSETTYPSASGRITSAGSSSKSSGITIDNPAFRDLILVPRRICIDPDQLSRSAFQHFQTTKPDRYQEIEGLESTTVFLEGEDVFKSNIVDQYKEMKEWGLCEAEYAQYAMEHLLKSETRVPHATPSRAWRTKRMIQLVAKPERRWVPPPVIDTPTPPVKEYNFDVRPDCAYWIPIEVFNERYRNLVKQLTFSKYRKIVCPISASSSKKTIQRRRRQKPRSRSLVQLLCTIGSN